MNEFLGKRILVLTAHPDDESYAAAGTLYKNYAMGGQTALLCATFGEKGTSHLKKELSTKALKKIREKELQQVCQCLHIATWHILGVPDGEVAKHQQSLIKQVLSIADDFKPEVIMSFGADGISGHCDHIAAGNVAKKIAKQKRIILVEFSLPPLLQPKAKSWLRQRRNSGHYAKQLEYKKPTARVPINTAIKKKALRCHASQMDDDDAFTGFPAYAVEEMLQAEHFRVINKKDL